MIQCAKHWTVTKHLFSIEREANVCYQEFDVPNDFPLELRQYLPNNNYKSDTQRQDDRLRFLRILYHLVTSVLSEFHFFLQTFAYCGSCVSERYQKR